MTGSTKLPPFPELRPDLLEEWDYERNEGIDPYSITGGSNRKVWWKCKNNPAHSWEANVSNRVRKGKGCPICAKQVVEKESSIAVLYPLLLKEWHPSKNGELDPYTISVGSARRVWWKCSNNPNHEWESFVFSRTKNGAGCPECKSITNNLASSYPKVAAEWHFERNGKLTPRDVTEKSGKIAWWKCTRCLFEWKAKVVNRTHLKSGCPICSREFGVINTKINQLEKLEAFEADYTYDSEELDVLDQELHEIFDNHLKIDQETRSIDSLFSPRMISRIDYQPYYQRNYVWDNNKASYFIESIVIGTEIPPIILFETNHGFEIIDGRQRYETIKRFMEGDFSLSRKGLFALSNLGGTSFSELSSDYKDYFLDAHIRIVRLSIVNRKKIDQFQEDRFKKEVFRRYNSGITPLRRFEVDKAVYIRDEPTTFLKKQFKKNNYIYQQSANLFLAERDKKILEQDSTIEKLLQVVRLLLVIADMPITSIRRKATVDQFYERFSESISNISEVYDSYLEKVRILVKIAEYFEQNGSTANRYWNETLYWGLSVLKKEGVQDIDAFVSNEFVESALAFYQSNIEVFSTDSKQFLHREHSIRYEAIANFLNDVTGKDLSIYLSHKGFKYSDLARIDQDDSDEDERVVRIEKQEAAPFSIDDISRLMTRGRFLVRPPYQRGEVINKTKSSAIIESILLGIKLPPLFVYRRTDDVNEVIDGQQRILSILGFMGLHFLNEKGEKIFSNKNEFKLSGLRILKELNGKGFSDLHPSLQDKIYDFSLSLIHIDQRINPEFDPVDLFVRLNNRPYPIKDNTFEMWNSYVSNEIIDSIKNVARRHEEWFYLTKNNVRMRNEELLTILSYLEQRIYEDKVSDINDIGFMEVISRETGVGVRLKEKASITKMLNKATIEPEYRDEILRSIKRLDSFVSRVKSILLDTNVDDVNGYLEQELTKLFNVARRKWYARKLQDFYGLWYIAHFLPAKLVLKKRDEVKSDLSRIFVDMKGLAEDDQPEGSDDTFKALVSNFRDSYKPNERKIRLKKEEIQVLISNQNNICPLCKGKLYNGDDIEVDHIYPLVHGGPEEVDNLQVTHKHCNRSKGSGS